MRYACARAQSTHLFGGLHRLGANFAALRVHGLAVLRGRAQRAVGGIALLGGVVGGRALRQGIRDRFGDGLIALGCGEAVHVRVAVGLEDGADLIVHTAS
jgi:hypothetical protein